MSDETLYARLGGYNAIAAVAADLVGRLQQDEKLGRFWQHRGTDGIARELQLLVDFLCHVTGGPVYYTGRGMKLTHAGMGITPEDWQRFSQYAQATLAAFSVPEREAKEVASFVQNLKDEIVDAVSVTACNK